ncbi:MAG: hypothetical protein CMH54_05275 [Myxococcales bacterium]|nr:hypothetical protein [Myxococcales bacterium]|tara:strand:+ start:1800 stop:2321 length:522 start_codon:yes stop_codon:yes gene_type:complete
MGGTSNRQLEALAHENREKDLAMDSIQAARLVMPNHVEPIVDYYQAVVRSAETTDDRGQISRMISRLEQDVDQIDRVRQNLVLSSVGTKNEEMAQRTMMLQASLEQLLKKLRKIHKELTDADWTYFLTQRNMAKLASTAPKKPDDDDKQPTEVVPDKQKPASGAKSDTDSKKT